MTDISIEREGQAEQGTLTPLDNLRDIQEAIKQVNAGVQEQDILTGELQVLPRLNITDHINIDERLITLVSHEYRNVVNKLSGYLSLWQQIGDSEEIGGDLLQIGKDYLEAAINLVQLFDKEAFRDPLPLDRLLETFPDAERERVDFSNDEGITFRSLEEAMSIRTLLHNAFTAAGRLKEEEQQQQCLVHLLVGESSGLEEDRITYFLIDNISESWSERTIYQVNEAYTEGQEKPKIPYEDPRGGLQMVAYLAGQRGDSFSLLAGGSDTLKSLSQTQQGEFPTLETDENGNVKGKAVVVSFKEPHQEQSEV